MNNIKGSGWQVGWGTVPSCNMRCQFCYSGTVRSENNITTNLSDWKKFIDENHDYIEAINYGTGENTISDDWFYLIHYIRKKYPQIKQALTTNGFLSEKVKLPKFEKIILESIDEVDVSLDFSIEEKHNEFRGVKDAYRFALGALEFCSKNNIVTTIVFIGTPQTVNIENMIGLFKIAKKYGAKIRMNIYRPISMDPLINKKFILPFNTLIEALYYINDNYKILSIADPLICSIITEDQVEQDPFSINSIRIIPDGSITPSTYLISPEFRYANIKDSNVLKELTLPNVQQILQLPDDCQECAFKNRCRGGVFDRRYLYYKTFNARDPYCPFIKGNYLPKKKIDVIKPENFSSIHYGYLPTIFFAPV